MNVRLKGAEETTVELPKVTPRIVLCENHAFNARI